MKKEKIEGTGVALFHFEPGERAKIKRDRYTASHKTPLWTEGYKCTVTRNNEIATTVQIDGYEEEKHYIDTKDLVPLTHQMDTLT